MEQERERERERNRERERERVDGTREREREREREHFYVGDKSVATTSLSGLWFLVYSLERKEQ